MSIQSFFFFFGPLVLVLGVVVLRKRKSKMVLKGGKAEQLADGCVL